MLGDQIRSIRKRQEITLKELAEKTGLSIGYISQIERNLTDPPSPPCGRQRRPGGPHLPVFGGRAPRQPDFAQGGDDPAVPAQLQRALPNHVPHAHRGIRAPVPGGPVRAGAPQRGRGAAVIHPSEEIVLLERGAVDVIIDGKPVHLEAGDTTLICSNLPHILSNPRTRWPWGIPSSPPRCGSPAPTGTPSQAIKPKNMKKASRWEAFFLESVGGEGASAGGGAFA